ncbi:MAG: TIGR03668 family PPOX class F420-dependent oxidoreductase [Acetobacteraceae bacterium]|nr:TIGR03668 family PPOX class F420-dependent oxidoreductase [Acetobacteraceae bacterium]
MTLTPEQRRFIEGRRIGHLATADAAGVPQVVPVGFALSADAASLYIGIDEKPKAGPATRLKRLRNIAANPAVAIVFDHYEEDWRHLGWVMLRGRAGILEADAAADAAEHADARRLLLARYPQYAAMALDRLPVIAIRIATVRAWGQLEKDHPP